LSRLQNIRDVATEGLIGYRVLCRLDRKDPETVECWNFEPFVREKGLLKRLQRSISCLGTVSRRICILQCMDNRTSG
jgi:EAL domain-containing protein (putative c-di-GMP-specific phosphodiesterase class I)